MSVWTHVIGCVRVEAFTPDESLEKVVKDILGPISRFGKSVDTILPCGSEGSLQYKIVEYDKGMPWIIIPIWGDLRDYGSGDMIEFEMWWNSLLNQLKGTGLTWIRDAIIRVSPEDEDHVIILLEDGEKVPQTT